MVVVHHVVMLAIGLGAPSGQGQQMRAAHEHFQPVIEQADPQPVPDQAGGSGVEHFAQGEAAGAGDGDDNLVEVRGALLGQVLQMGALRLDALAPVRIAPADSLIDEGTIGAQILEVQTTAHEQTIPDCILEMTMSTLDRAVLMRYALVVLRWGHAIVTAKGLVSRREICSRFGVEIAEGGREAVAAVIMRRTNG